jgi:uncharacterized protein (DUF849 family)
MLIKACLNGSQTPGAYPALPLSATEIAREAERAVRAGAHALHIHLRNADGEETLAARACAAVLTEVRARCPDIPIGLTTGFWIEQDTEQRLAHIRAWAELPDFVSVNFSEPGTKELCAVLLERGIGVEAGLSSERDVGLLLEMGLAERCVRLLIEPGEDALEPALQNVERIEWRLNEQKVQRPRLLHGLDETAWPLLGIALQRGYDIRIGLEDTLHVPDGTRARDPY